ncbi:MAG: NACHT domain-containing protein [Blastocatellia bacterium]
MNNTSAIRLLAATNNERGDLFTRLTKDLFFALGYDDLRLDVHKSGRELDIQGKHRFEPRRVVGECKAHAAKMGGDELNKFLGALTRERKKSASIPVAGYFVSLGGFTETGIEQEIETGDDRIILLDAQKIVEELEKCRVIAGRTDAAERAGHCAQHAGLHDAVLNGAELLGHQRGYLWAIYYAHGKERTHVALIHADGTPLAEAVALEIIHADRLCGGSLHSLQYLAPPAQSPDRIALAVKTAASYRQWVGEECGYIHLDGLPADTDLSATRMRLERLFVPLKVSFLSKPDDDPALKQTVASSIGEILKRVSHLALLAVPGGGKSTLLKRLATAYAFPERRGEVSDDLPERDWMPLVLRCRELRDRAHRPILELLDDIPRHAGMNAGECAIFQESIHNALRAGQALLLVDGLDEISDEGARQTFAKHLRTFVAMFPQAALIVTSREAGFRSVAGVVASVCEQAKLTPLDEEDVLNLCERWHVEVVGDNDKVRAEARELGQTIWGNERVRKLTENPLLLTTLLVVKRWIGELPRSRAALYREAIRVLVRTWNVEGYAPLDEDETLAQLSYVACAMMEEGKQQIGHKELLKLLKSSRRELDAELQFARISPQEFIERIEYRSSLLMQTGYENIDGELQPVYEFRHLTFQEYLAARGYVEEQYRGRNLGQSLADVLERHFEDERWREVIPLAAVLAGRKVEELIKRLTAICKRHRKSNRLGVLLYQCILDEVQVTAPTLRLALIELAHELYVKYGINILDSYGILWWNLRYGKPREIPTDPNRSNQILHRC